MNPRGMYIGQAPPSPATIYVERAPTTSIVTWLLGTAAVGGALLWARHQSRQLEQLYKLSELPYKSFTSSLREGAVSLIRGRKIP